VGSFFLAPIIVGRYGLRVWIWAQAAGAALPFLMSLCWLPEPLSRQEERRPQSNAAAFNLLLQEKKQAQQQRENYITTLGRALRNKGNWLVAVPIGTALGLCTAYTAVLPQLCASAGLSQEQASFAACYCSLGQVVAGAVVGPLIDRCGTKLQRPALWLMTLLYVACYAAFLLLLPSPLWPPSVRSQVHLTKELKWLLIVGVNSLIGVVVGVMQPVVYRATAEYVLMLVLVLLVLRMVLMLMLMLMPLQVQPRRGRGGGRSDPLHHHQHHHRT